MAPAASRSAKRTSICWSKRCGSVCEPLAVGIVRGGEGATKLVTVQVTGAKTAADAKQAARAIANSPLVKTAVHGADPNWGRLVAVAGRAGVPFDLERARVQIGDVELFADGRPFDERRTRPRRTCSRKRFRCTSISAPADRDRRGCGRATSAPNT